MPTTMRDVARLAGVSVRTVSNVVNEIPIVREDTRLRVLVAIDALDYRMNVSARNLRAGRTGMIGLAIPELNLAYFSELADAVISEAESRGWTVLIEKTNGSRDREIQVLSGSRRHLVDGVILSPYSLGPLDVQHVRTDYPTVLLSEGVTDDTVDHVTMSDGAAAAAATRHLVELGRRRIAVIGAYPVDAVGMPWHRMQGYLAALEQAGLAPRPELMMPATVWHRENGAQAMRALLTSRVEVDAVFCFNDNLALGALRALHEAGRCVPDDVALVGFDDIEDTRYSTPTVTSISPGREQVARTAVEMLIRRIEARDDAGPAVAFTADFVLMARESTLGRAR